MTGASEPGASDADAVAAAPVQQASGVMIAADGSMTDLQGAHLGQGVTQPDPEPGSGGQ